MDPTITCCPKRHGPASGQTGQGPIGLHAQKAQRFLWHACHKTCSARQGTVFSRRRTSAEPVALVVTLLAHGCPGPAIVAACGFAERTVADWWARSGRQGQGVHTYLVEPPRERGQGPADERRVKQQGGIVWRARAMMGQTRLWLGRTGSEPRDRTLIRRRLERVRRCAAPCPLLVCPDGGCPYRRAMRETLRAPGPTGQGGRPRWRPWRNGLIAHVVKRYARRRVAETDRRLGDGTPARVETLRRRSQGDGGIKTAAIERLTATFRERLAPLARRCRALARHTLPLAHGMSLVGTV
jgi:transposase-like protein